MTTSIWISVLSGPGFNNNVPSIRGLKKALAAEEGIIAVLGRSFEFAAVFIMTIYGLKALLIGLDDVPTFAEFFFTVNPPRIFGDQNPQLLFDTSERSLDGFALFLKWPC